MSHSQLAVKIPWQQIIDITLFVAIDDGGKNAGDFGVGHLTLGKWISAYRHDDLMTGPPK